MNMAKRMYVIALLLFVVLICQNLVPAVEGASFNIIKDSNNEKPTQAIVAVAGISPPLFDKALSLFDPNGDRSNSHFFTNLFGGGSKDKVLAFPIQKPNIKPLQPAPLAPVATPAQHLQEEPSGEKDQTPSGPVPLSPLTPLKPVDSNEPLETTSLEHSVENQPASPIETQSSEVPPEVMPSSSDDNQFTEELEETELAISNQPAASPTTGGGIGWGQNSQGGHNTGGTQHLSMNLNANQANINTTAQVDMHVVSEQSSNSNTNYYFGSRGIGKPYHQPHNNHHVYQHNNGVTNYIVQFNKRTVDNDDEDDKNK